MYLKNSQPRRDLPIPPIPVTETRYALPSSAEAWNSSFNRRSSRSRPTNGASNPSAFNAPRPPETTRSARHTGTNPVLPFTSWLPADSYTTACSGAPPRPLPITPGPRRPPPHRHHRITNELLPLPAVQPDQTPTRLEITRKKLPRILRIPPLRRRREPDQIRKQHRHEAPLRHRLRRRGRHSSRYLRNPHRRGHGRALTEHSTALAAELLGARDLRAAGRAG